MFCPQCGAQVPDEAQFCPQCGASFAASQPINPTPEVAQNAQVPPQAAVQPGYAPNQYAYAPAAPNPLEKDMKTAYNLGLASLIGGIFIPLVGYICGGIGLSKINKLNLQANAVQQQSLKKSKKLCIAGIVVPTVLIVLSIIASIIIMVFVANEARKLPEYFSDDNYKEYSQEYEKQMEEYEKQVEDYLKQYGVQ